MPLPARPLADRLWEKVNIGDPESCWEWAAPVHHPDGAGRIHCQGRGPLRAPLAAWIETHGPIPAGLEVCHECDNPLCCNPGHLFLDTHAGNMADMRRKGRATGGGDYRKLSERDRSEIAERYLRGGVTQKELAREYGVRPEWVYRIVRRCRTESKV